MHVCASVCLNNLNKMIYTIYILNENNTKVEEFVNSEILIMLKKRLDV